MSRLVRRLSATVVLLAALAGTGATVQSTTAETNWGNVKLTIVADSAIGSPTAHADETNWG